MKNKFCYLLFLLSFFLNAQNIYIEKLDIKNGLPDNSVRDIIQDEHGYLWFGTLNGLSRFDGKSFKNYNSIPGDTTSLTNSRMVKISEDKKGFIWCWADDLNLQRVNPITNEVLNLNKHLLKRDFPVEGFRITSNGDMWAWGNNGCTKISYIENSYQLKAEIFNTKNGLTSNDVHFVFEDLLGNMWIGTENSLVKIKFSKGEKIINTYYQNTSFISFNTHKNNIWFGTTSKGIIKYNPKTNKFIPVVSINKKLKSNSVISINQYNDDILLLGSNEFLLEYNIPKDESSLIYHENFNGISKFYNDSFNNTWLIAQKRGIFKYSIGSKKIEYYDLDAEERFFLGDSDKQKILEDSNKNLWIGIHGGGLFLYNRNNNTFSKFKSNEEKIGSLSSNIVLSIFEDSSKNLWVGTMYGGINKINLTNENFIWHKPINNPINIFENEIRASVEDIKGRLWLGSKGGKIFCYSNYDLQFTFPDDLSKENQQKFKNINVYSLYIDHLNNMWIGTKGKGLFVIKSITDTAPKNLEIIHIESKNSKALNDVYAIIQDHNKNYWFGSHGYGLAQMSTPFNNPKITTYTQKKSSDQLLSNYIRCLFFDKDHNLWIGTSDGINLLMSNELNKKNKKFISIKNIKNSISSLTYNSVDHIFQASDNSIYLSTMGGGMNILNYSDFKDRKFKFTHLSVANGLSSNKIFAMQEDIDKNIWISTSLGLNKYYPKRNKFENFFVEGYGLNYFTEGCVNKLNNGDFLFGHHKGFLTFNPKNITKDTTAYPLVLSKFFVNGNEQIPRKSDIIQKNIEYIDNVELSYTQNTIRFDFSVLDFKNPEKIQYSYKLDHFDKNWSTPLTSNTAIYQNLPHGNYTFLLKATNSDGLELPKTLKFNVNIKPPFFKSYLGYFLMVLFFGSIFFAFLYLYKRQISAKNSIVFADKLNEKKLVYYTNISHEFKTPLTLISCHLQDIIDDNEVSNQTKLSTKKIQKSTTYLLNLVEQILDFRKIREEKMKLLLINTNIVDFIKNIHDQFMPLATKEGINLSFKTNSENIVGHIDVKMLKKIVYNLLSNAIKFTPSDKSIKISLKLINNNEYIKIKIKDEGKGISKEDQKHLFERFGKSENSSGIGLFYVKELVNCHKGTIEVTSEIDQGTCFNILLPIHKKHYKGEDIEVSDIVVNESNFYEPKLEVQKDFKTENANKQYSILIIDDNDEMRDYLGTKFQQYFNVFTAENGKTGVEAAIKEVPDIIVCDLMMPLVDGIGAIKLLRENFNTCHIPIVLLTANSSEHKKIEGIKIGADDYITKPFNFKYLKLKIDALINQRNIIIQSFSKNPELSMDILTNTDEDKKFIEQVKLIVEETIGEADFSINLILSKMGLSRTVFYKKMKEITGETPHEFISTIQMKKAALLLKNTNYTIAEVSLTCGFNDANYFSKIFKKYFGQTPKTYQVEHKTQS
ncbi:two-component regulator propeller domain-containing protein [Wenyingzhuangia sp. chi5]|uniref:histidine kinase n=1 Tax=Wenyingzhuangia gilva TaxID=3057677 RepID=A0ABT8VMR1_9FLAO|nr:two-component regulator propeller domain-containing protein [Wenyingzhuangia sp. chi5]MDO3693259.1 two-component regulator propeller domain-containing protein [Wenyingzhuangia sp. chi5]